MIEKLSKWILNIAGYSYVSTGIGTILIFWLVIGNFNLNEFIVKVMFVGLVYFISLALVHLSNRATNFYALLMWCISLVLNVVLVVYVAKLLKGGVILLVLLPEILIVGLLIYGIYYLFSRQGNT